MKKIKYITAEYICLKCGTFHVFHSVPIKKNKNCRWCGEKVKFIKKIIGQIK